MVYFQSFTQAELAAQSFFCIRPFKLIGFEDFLAFSKPNNRLFIFSCENDKNGTPREYLTYRSNNLRFYVSCVYLDNFFALCILLGAYIYLWLSCITEYVSFLKILSYSDRFVEKIDTNQMPFLEFEMMKYFWIKTILNIYLSIRANVKKKF